MYLDDSILHQIHYILIFENTLFLKYLNNGAYLNKLGNVTNPTVFKLHITHNFFMAFACLLWGYFSIYLWSRQRFFAIISVLFFLFSLINVFFMVQGRTGYLVIFFAALYLLIHRYGLKGFLYGLFASVLFGLALFYSADNFHNRIVLGASEALNWNQATPSSSSVGLRIEFFWQSLVLSLDHLIFGVGVGNFKYAYAQHVSGLGMIATINPHNQYILILVEMGIVGLCSFLYLNYLCWASANQLNSFWKHSTRIVILCYGVANLFNSFLFDFSESLFFSAFMALAFSQLIHKKSETSS
jgi:O-antigen ligase